MNRSGVAPIFLGVIVYAMPRKHGDNKVDSPFNQDNLNKLKKAYATGILRVRLGDNLIEYKSEEEMRRTIERIERELGKGKNRFVQLKYNKGL